MSDTRDFLLEIGLEEIPARFLPPAVEQLDSLARQAFAAVGLKFAELHIYATPRRLAVLVTALAEKADDVMTEVKGPSVSAAFDAEGMPTKALLGFCKGHGVAAKDVYQKELSGNKYIFATKKSLGKYAGEMLPDLIYGLVNKLYFPKPMRWGYETMRFARPVRWLLAMFGTEVIDIELAKVKSANISRGHRLLGSDHIVINQPAEYLAKLEENFVICDQDKRKAIIKKQIADVAQALGGYVEEDAELLEEVTYLLEYPTALSGGFEEKYLAIPKELVITPMREHQRYFPVYAKDGSLLPRFITVRNGDGRFLDIVAAGNEKVLRARLADAEFFYLEDLQDNMDAKVEQLANVVFHEKLGTMRAKVGRIIQLAVLIGQILGFTEEELQQTRRAAYLAKADLGSRVVYEFPELQGIIGEYYAVAAGENITVAQAVREHYLPRFAGDEVPQSKPGIAISLADKIDSLTGFFAIGMIPSGSQDPYALRRAAAGCAQIIVKHGLQLSLQEILPYSFELLAEDVQNFDKDHTTERMEGIISFFKQRLENIMSEDGISYDIINAVGVLNDTDLYMILCKAHALHQYRGNAGFPMLLSGFNRAANLLKSAKEKGGIDLGLVKVNQDLFVDQTEKALWLDLQAANDKVRPALTVGNYTAALDVVGELTDSINKFFEAVMVMDKDNAVRDNRLALLCSIVSLTEDIGDLSKIVAE